MNKVLYLPAIVALLSSVAPIALAQRQTAIGPGVIPLNATGELGGVDLSASANTGTLSVGVPGGPATDIFTLNNPVIAGFTAVSTAASSQGNIVFNSGSTVFGAIGVTQPGGPFLLNISGGNTGTAVNFMGPVHATTLDVSGRGAVNFNSGNTNIVATNFAADGLIRLSTNTTLIGALTTTAGANTGTLSMAGGSVLDGAVGGAVGLRSINVTGGSDAAGVTATISGAANAHAFSLGTNTLNVGGALTLANGGPGGVVNTTLASSSVYGNIRPVGATNLGPSLTVNVLVPPTTLLTVGTQFNIIQTRAGTVQSGTDGSTVAVTIQNPTNPLYTFAAVPLAGTSAGLVSIVTTRVPLLVPVAPPPDIVLPPTTPIAAVVIPAILPAAVTIVPVPVGVATPAGGNILVVNRPDLVSVLAPINALSDPIAVVSAVTQLAPSASNLAAPLVVFEGTRQYQALWSPRLENILCEQPAQSETETQACRGNPRRNGAWINGFGYSASQDSRQSFVGYTASAYGLMIGYDTQVSPNTRAGIAFGVGRTDINGRVFNAQTDIQSYVGTVYLGHERGPWYLHGAASIGLHDHSDTRNINYPGVSRQARSDAMGQDYTLHGATGYHLQAQDWRITPMASLQYSRVNLGSFQESGAGDLNLNIASRGYDFLESGLGVKVARPFSRGDMIFRPEVHARWLHQFANPNMTQTASLQVPGAASFTTPGFTAARDTLNIGAGITLLSCDCATRIWSVEAVYDYYQRTDGFTAHRGMVRLAGRF
jgi:outer membrane autotransporter protein